MSSIASACPPTAMLETSCGGCVTGSALVWREAYLCVLETPASSTLATFDVLTNSGMRKQQVCCYELENSPERSNLWLSGKLIRLDTLLPALFYEHTTGRRRYGPRHDMITLSIFRYPPGSFVVLRSRGDVIPNEGYSHGLK